LTLQAAPEEAIEQIDDITENEKGEHYGARVRGFVNGFEGCEYERDYRCSRWYVNGRAPAYRWRFIGLN
jgi:hypothetical protein